MYTPSCNIVHTFSCKNTFYDDGYFKLTAVTVTDCNQKQWFITASCPDTVSTGCSKFREGEPTRFGLLRACVESLQQMYRNEFGHTYENIVLKPIQDDVEAACG